MVTVDCVAGRQGRPKRINGVYVLLDGQLPRCVRVLDARVLRRLVRRAVFFVFFFFFVFFVFFFFFFLALASSMLGRKDASDAADGGHGKPRRYLCEARSVRNYSALWWGTQTSKRPGMAGRLQTRAGKRMRGSKRFWQKESVEKAELLCARPREALRPWCMAGRCSGTHGDLIGQFHTGDERGG